MLFVALLSSKISKEQIFKIIEAESIVGARSVAEAMSRDYTYNSEDITKMIEDKASENFIPHTDMWIDTVADLQNENYHWEAWKIRPSKVEEYDLDTLNKLLQSSPHNFLENYVLNYNII